MKLGKKSRTSAIGIALGIVLSRTAVAQDDGAFEVGGPEASDSLSDPNGSFTRFVPIALPPGRGYATPKLGLSYVSSSPDGMNGTGWRLSGLPVIQRVGATTGINYDGNDTYVLGQAWEKAGAAGSVLAEAPPTSVAAGTFFLRNADGTQYVPMGSCGDGPCYWIARDPSGLFSTYFGGDEDSFALTQQGQPDLNFHAAIWEKPNGVHSARGIQVWLFYKLRDLHGNEYGTSYQAPAADGYERYPISLSYGIYNVVFSYVNRPLIPITFDSGVVSMPKSNGLIATTKLMNKIDVLSRTEQGAPLALHSLALNYEYSQHTGRAQLTRIDPSAPDSDAPYLELAYHEGGEDPVDPTSPRIVPTIFSSDPAAWPPTAYKSFTADVNGDGYQDVVRIEGYRPNRYIAFVPGGEDGISASAQVVEDPYSTIVPQLGTVTGDVDGDGRDDAVIIFGDASGIRIRAARGSGGGLLEPAMIAQVPSPGPVAFLSHGDFDGDRRVDLAFGLGGGVHVALAANSYSLLATTGALATGIDYPAIVADFNGDGRDDLCRRFVSVSPNLSWQMAYACYLGSSGAFVPDPSVQSISFIGSNASELADFHHLVGDVNSDGRADVVMVHPRAAVGDVDVFLAFGDTVGLDWNQFAPVLNFAIPSVPAHAILADINGNGRQDLVLASFDKAGAPNGWIQVFAGNLLGELDPLPLYHTSSLPFAAADFIFSKMVAGPVTADPFADLIFVVATETGNHARILTGAEDFLLSEYSVVPPATPYVSDVSSSTPFELADLNGDGWLDGVWIDGGSQDSWSLLSDGSFPDLLTSLETEAGARYEVEYVAAAHEIGAIDKDSSSCRKHVLSASCGPIARNWRPLVRRFQVHRGSDELSDHEMTYRNGRDRYDPISGLQFAGFEQIVREETLSGTARSAGFIQTTVTPVLDYTIDWIDLASEVKAFQRNHTHQELFFEWADGPILVSDIETHVFYENGQIDRGETFTRTHDDLGNITQLKHCYGSSDCTSHENRYARNSQLESQWIIGRPTVEWTQASSGRLIDGREYEYLPTNSAQLKKVRSILFGDFTQAFCTDLTLIPNPTNEPSICSAEVSQGAASRVTILEVFDRDSYGNPLVVKDAMSRQFNFDTDWRGTFASGMTMSGAPFAGSQRKFNDFGQVVEEIDPNAQTWSFSFDTFGRPKSASSPEGELFSATYTDGPNRSQSSTLKFSTSASKVVTSMFDEMGGVSLIHEAGAPAVYTCYDSFWRDGLWVERESRPSASSACTQWLELEHDSRSRPLRLREIQGSQASRAEGTFSVLRTLQTYQYNLGQSVLTDAGGFTTTHLRDHRGRTQTIRNAEQEDTTLVYDEAGRVTQVTLPNSDWRTFRYDGWGRRIYETYDSPTNRPRQPWAARSYRLDGNVDLESDPIRQIKYHYDLVGRLEHEEELGTGFVSTFTYDSAPSFGIGRLHTAIAGANSTQFNYTQSGLVASVSETIQGVTQQAGFTYDLSGDVRAVSLPLASSISFNQDAEGRPSSITFQDSCHTRTLATYSNFDLYGYPQAETRSDASVTTYAFDSFHRPSLVRETRGSAVLRHLVPTYNARDLVEHLDDLRPAQDKNLHAVDTDQTQDFSYDPLGRIATASGVFGTETYGFDEAGWPLNLADTAIGYSSCAGDTCVTGAGADNWVAQYDGNGRRVSFQDATTSFEYEYDWKDKLVRVATHDIDLQYDAFGDRVFDAIPSAVSAGRIETRSFFGGAHVERTEGGKTQRIRNVEGPTGLLGAVVDVPIPSSPSLASVQTNRYAQLGGAPTNGLPTCAVVGGGSGCVSCGLKYRAEAWTVHGDLQGTPHIVTRANGGSAAGRLFNAPFGSVRTEHSTGTNFVPTGFIGAPTLQAAIGGSSLGARFYDSRTALFFTADELIHGGLGGEQGFNPYSYALNNPIRYSDPLGLSPGDEDGESWTDYPPFELEIIPPDYDDPGYLDWLDQQEAQFDDPEPVPVDLSGAVPEWLTWIGGGETAEELIDDAASAEEARAAARGAERFGPGVLIPKLTAAFYGSLAGAMQPPTHPPLYVENSVGALGRAAERRVSKEMFKALAKQVGLRGLQRLGGNLRAKGGIYVLVKNGVVKYVGRTKDFVAREAAHSLDPRFAGLQFQPLLHTARYAEQRGLEEVAIQAFGGAGKQILNGAGKGLLNRIGGVSPRSLNGAKYYRAAVRYLERYSGQ